MWRYGRQRAIGDRSAAQQPDTRPGQRRRRRRQPHLRGAGSRHRCPATDRIDSDDQHDRRNCGSWYSTTQIGLTQAVHATNAIDAANASIQSQTLPTSFVSVERHCLKMVWYPLDPGAALFCPAFMKPPNVQAHPVHVGNRPALNEASALSSRGENRHAATESWAFPCRQIRIISLRSGIPGCESGLECRCAGSHFIVTLQL